MTSMPSFLSVDALDALALTTPDDEPVPHRRDDINWDVVPRGDPFEDPDYLRREFEWQLEKVIEEV